MNRNQKIIKYTVDKDLLKAIKGMKLLSDLS